MDNELIKECLLDLDFRLKSLENKFNIEENDWELWHKLRLLNKDGKREQ